MDIGGMLALARHRLLGQHSILGVEPEPRESIFIFARKPLAGERPDNGAFTTSHASYLRKSRFREDRRRAA